VHFSNGEYRESSAPGSGSQLIVKLADKRAFGKLDGKEAGAVIVVTDPGGSGNFYDLALLVKTEQVWINQDVAFLGDRIKIHSLAVVNNEIAVDMTNHGPADAMCCPTRHVVQRYVLEENRLVKASEEVRGNVDPVVVDTVWKWEQTLHNNDTRSVPPNPEHYTLKLLPDGKVSIRADCNLGGGVYTLRGNEISIEITHTTRAACPPESLEQSYIRDLNAAAFYFMKGEFLYIDLKADTGTMKFMR
jgi:heat shock protein HslJ